MSRLAVKAKTSKESLVFEPIEATSEIQPMLYLPGDLISPGNSIGGYITIPDRSGDNWGLWRIGGSTKDRLRDPELRSDLITINGITRYTREILRITSGVDPEAVARNNGRYLIALSSGSARRGILHNLDRPSNPMLDILREAHIPTDGVETVSSSDGEYKEVYEYLFPRFRRFNKIFTDGKVSELSHSSGSDVDGRFNPNYPSGNGFSRRVISIDGSSFVISAYFAQSEFNVGPSRVPLSSVSVKITPDADRKQIEEILSSITSKS